MHIQDDVIPKLLSTQGVISAVRKHVFPNQAVIGEVLEIVGKRGKEEEEQEEEQEEKDEDWRVRTGGEEGGSEEEDE
eukprot:8832910-Pyramimonas_sp.AAC.1